MKIGIIVLLVLFSISKVGANDKHKVENDLFIIETDSAIVLKEAEKALSEWLDFYELNINEFESDWSIIEFMPEDIKSIDTLNEESFFVIRFSEEEFEYKPILREYSPNKQYYIPIYEHITQYDEESKQFYLGFDDSQNIWLYNTKTKLAYMIQFFGTSSIAEGAYWLDNYRMILVGKSYDEETICFFYIFDLKKMRKSYFYNSKNLGNKETFYRHVLKQRGLNIVLD